MGRCEKCPVNFGITTAEGVIRGFNPESLKDENGDAVRISRNTAMARAAYEQAVKLIDCKYDPDPQPAEHPAEGEASAFADLGAEDQVPLGEDSAVDGEAPHVPSAQEQAVLQMLLGSGERPARPACLEHFQIALNFLSVNTQTGPETVFPDGSKTPTHKPKGESGTGQYL